MRSSPHWPHDVGLDPSTGSSLRVAGVARGDGKLTHDLDPLDRGPQDACGVFGVWAPGDEVAKLTYFGLYALQHRGQESAGIAVSDGHHIVVMKDMGLVSQVFTEASLESLKGFVAIGHTRYSTTGSSSWENAQPTFRATATGHFALGHNGNLTNTAELADRVAALEEARGELPLGTKVSRSTSDTDLITALIAAHPDLSMEAAAIEELPKLAGAYLPGVHGRHHPVCRARPPGHPTAGARPARKRMGRRQRNGSTGHRGCGVRARDRTG